MTSFNSCLTFHDNVKEALEIYTAVFGGEILRIALSAACPDVRVLKSVMPQISTSTFFTTNKQKDGSHGMDAIRLWLPLPSGNSRS